MPCCEISNRAQMSKTIIAVRHFELGGRVSLKTAVIASKNYQCTVPQVFVSFLDQLMKFQQPI